MSRLDLLMTRADLLASALPSIGYCSDNGIDFAATVPCCGGVFLAEIQPHPPRWFMPQAGGQLAAWIDLIDEDGETVLDSLAWPIDRPDRVLRLTGAGAVLGMARANDPMIYTLDHPLRVHRTPLQWLQAGCEGIVVLDPHEGVRQLLDIPTTLIEVADWGHRNEMRRDLEALVRRRYVVSHQVKRAA